MNCMIILTAGGEEDVDKSSQVIFLDFVKLRVRVRVRVRVKVKVKSQTSKLDPEVGVVMG